MEITPKPIEDRGLWHAQANYMETLFIWCQIKFPFGGESAYKQLRNHVSRYARYKESKNEIESAIETINKKREALEEDLNLNADKYLFYGEY